MKAFLVDTSAWYALINRRDPSHINVFQVLKEAPRLVSTNFIFDETITLCRQRLGFTAACRVGHVLRNHPRLDLIRLENRDEQSAWKLFQDRSDKHYSYTDCTSFSLMRRLGLDTAVAKDADFLHEGFQLMPAP